jgi:MFS family permease
MLSFIFVSIDLLQPMLLFQKFTVKRSDEFHNMKNAGVIGCDIAVKILVAPFFGYFADRLGRKIVNTYGIIIIAASMAIIPFCEEFWQYILARMFYAHGT